MTLFSESITKVIQGFKDKIVAFSVMRNERFRVEGWITHYRNIGIRQFFIIDNGSSDGTYEFLLEQHDVVVERTHASFQDSKFGIEWLNSFRAIIGPDKWVLFADADELIVYDGWPKHLVAEIIDKAETLGCNAFFGFMLDMYPDGPLDSSPSEACKNLFSIAPCFDSDYEFKFLPKKPWTSPTINTVSVIGGPRVRFLSTMERERSVTWLDLFIREQTDRIVHWTPALFVQTIVRHLPKWMPALNKTPLTKGGTEFQYGNNHGGSGGKYYKQNVVLCHFKFLHDFDQRVRTEVARKEHYRHGAEYVMYADLIGKHGCLDFRYAGTQRFVSSEQLVSLGLIRDMAWTRMDG
jgi:glycosyltransferase involved in cell wall biosynthesis